MKRILIADDHDVLRGGIRALIEAHDGWQIVAEAADGLSALEAARSTRPDIAVLDHSLPIFNGLDLTHSLRRELPGIEILIFTVHDNEEIIRAFLMAGARGYVLKTDHGRHLVAAIEALSMRKPYFSAAVSETLLERFLNAGPGVALTTLTQRERQIVQLIAEGKINKEIGQLLDISVKTVETHRASVMHKLKLKTTAELVRYAVRNNIVQA